MRHVLVLVGGALIVLAAAAIRGPRPKAERVRKTSIVSVIEPMKVSQREIVEEIGTEEDDCEDPQCSECLRPGN